MVRALRAVLFAPLLAGLVSLAPLAACPPARAQLLPEAEAIWQDKELARAERHMVVAAHPLAAEAGRAILRKGGSAVDAAIAAQMVLNLVEPQSSGIGGGAFLLQWDAEAGTLTSYDGRETAPAAARPDRFLDADGRPLDFRTAVRSGRSVGVPGLLRMLALAHAHHGRLPWAELFAPAIALAEEGFPVSRRLNMMLRWQGRDAFGPEGQRVFFNADGHPHAADTVLTNPQLAATLRAVAKGGADAFYTGDIARDIVEAVNAAPLSLADMTLADLAGYEARERPPVCVVYRAHEVCGMGPPSSGGLTVAMALRLLEPFDLGEEPLNRPALHLIAAAQNLAFADRGRYMADSDFQPVPDGLLDPDYLEGRRALIDPDRALGQVEPGTPPGAPQAPGPDGATETPGTSHVSIVDGDGNAVSMTASIEGPFGSGFMVRGFLLNNELTDFAFRPEDGEGRPVANRVEAGKRPRSSMAPTIVLDAARALRLVTGSPGGARIINYVLKSVVATLDWGLDPQAAANLTNFGSRNGPLEFEVGAHGAGLALRMRFEGQRVSTGLMTSGLHIIAVEDGMVLGGADPRREGVALGD